MVTKGLSLSRWLLGVLLLCTLSFIAGAAAVMGAERGASGRSQRKGAGGGSGGAGEKRRKLHRIQHGQCSYTFILPEMDGCQAGGSPPHTQQHGGARGGSSVVQRDSPVDGEWSVQKLQHLESMMENNTQWLQKVRTCLLLLHASILDHVIWS